jgi:hypothetical protein
MGKTSFAQLQPVAWGGSETTTSREHGGLPTMPRREGVRRSQLPVLLRKTDKAASRPPLKITINN